MITDDATRKHLFQAPELVRDLVCTYVPHPWLSGLDFGTLEPVLDAPSLQAVFR